MSGSRPVKSPLLLSITTTSDIQGVTIHRGLLGLSNSATNSACKASPSSSREESADVRRLRDLTAVPRATRHEYRRRRPIEKGLRPSDETLGHRHLSARSGIPE